MRWLLCIACLVAVKCLSQTETDFTVTFLKEHSTMHCFFLVCWKNSDKVRITKIFMQKQMDISITFLSPEEGAISKAKINNYSKITYVLDFSCKNAYEILREVFYNLVVQLNGGIYRSSKTLKFTLTNSWLILATADTSLEDIKQLFDKIELRMDMDVKIAIPKNNGNQYDIYEIYDPGLEVDYKVNKIGVFLDRKLYRAEKTFFKSRMNMTGVLIRNGNSVNFTKELLEKNRNMLHYQESGALNTVYLYHVFHRFKELMRFHDNVTIGEPWSSNAHNGTDTGLGQLLYNNTVDIQIAGGAVVPSRVNNFELMVIPYMNIKMSFFYRAPGIKKPGAQVMKPLAPKVWYCTLGAMVVTGAALKTVFWIENKLLKNNEVHNFFASVLILIAVLAQQGSEVFPQQMGGRILFLNFLVFSIWIYNYYTTGLVSSLLNSKPQMLTSFKDLYESPLELGMQIPYHVKDFHDHDLEQLFAKKVYYHNSHKPYYYPLTEGVEKVRKGGFAFNAMVSSAYPIISTTFDQDAICDLGEINYSDFFSAMVLQKNSQYKELFLIGLTKMWESGITLQIYDQIGVKKAECRSSLLLSAAGPQELFLVYMIFFVGVLLATIMLFAEILYDKIHKLKNKRNTLY